MSSSGKVCGIWCVVTTRCVRASAILTNTVHKPLVCSYLIRLALRHSSPRLSFLWMAWLEFSSTFDQLHYFYIDRLVVDAANYNHTPFSFFIREIHAKEMRWRVGRWAGGQVGRWAGGQVGRWAGGQVGRWAGG